MSAFKDFFLA